MYVPRVATTETMVMLWGYLFMSHYNNQQNVRNHFIDRFPIVNP